MIQSVWSEDQDDDREALDDEGSESGDEEGEEQIDEEEDSGLMETFCDSEDEEDTDTGSDLGIDFGGPVGFLKPFVKMLDDMLYIGSKAMVTAVRFGYRMAKDKIKENAKRRRYGLSTEEEDGEDGEEDEYEEADPFRNSGGGW